MARNRNHTNRVQRDSAAVLNQSIGHSGTDEITTMGNAARLQRPDERARPKASARLSAKGKCFLVLACIGLHLVPEKFRPRKVRFSCTLFPDVPGVFDYAEPSGHWRVTRLADVAFPLTEKGRHSDCSFSQLNGQPAYASTDALAGICVRLEAEMVSLLLSHRALASPTMCRFSPALSVHETSTKPPSVPGVSPGYRSHETHETFCPRNFPKDNSGRGFAPSSSTHVVPRLRRSKHGAPVQEKRIVQNPQLRTGGQRNGQRLFFRSDFGQVPKFSRPRSTSSGQALRDSFRNRFSRAHQGVCVQLTRTSSAPVRVFEFCEEFCGQMGLLL
jgi:hypothetical protein